MSLLDSRLAVWISIAPLALALFPSAGFAAATEISLRASQANRIVLEVELGDLSLESVKIGGQAAHTLRADGTVSLMEAGAPELPVLRRTLLIDDVADIEARIVEKSVEYRSAGVILPSKGHLSRDVDPALVPYRFGAAYRTDQFYPAEEVVVHDPFIVRDFRGVVVELRPVRYNPVTGQLAVAKRLTVEISQKPGTGTNPLRHDRAAGGIDPEFLAIYENLFANWKMEGDRYAILPEPGRCLILTADPFYDAVLPLFGWDLQKGLPTILTRLSDVGPNATDVKGYIQSLYDAPEGLTYVVLVGDAAEMPYLLGTAENAPSDPMYVKLAGDDHYPDALISRISAQNVTQVETQVARSIRYEKTPDTGAAAAWYHRATGIASAQYGGGAYDWQRADWLRDSLLTHTFTDVDQFYSPNATKQMVLDALNEGRSVLNYLGHGSETYWVTTGFDVQDVYSLENGFRNPYICDVACVNGDFTYNESFAEAWLRAGTAETPKGAIGIYAASTDASWVPPCDMQSEVIRLMTEGTCMSLGGLSFNGVMKAMDLWPGYEATKLMEQYHLFGDCTVLVRTDVPAPLVVEHDGTLPFGQSTYMVATPGVSGARVALYADQLMYDSVYSDETGQAVLSIDPLPPAGTELLLTVSGANLETVVETVSIVPSSDAAVGIETWSLGGEAVVVGVSTPLDVELRNDGTDPATGVTAILRGIAGIATVIDSSASFGDIDPGSTAWGNDGFTFIPDPNLPDGSDLDLTLEIVTDDGWRWVDTLQVNVQAPLFTYEATIVDDAIGDHDWRCDAGEEPLLTVGIGNVGSAGAGGIVARLLCLDPKIQLLQADAALDTLASEANGYLDPAFVLQIDPSYLEGFCEFSLELVTGNGKVQEIGFSIPIGGWFEAVESGEAFCSHDAGDGFVDQWHVDSQANVTPGGAHAWFCGSDIDSSYAPGNDARLTLPPLTLSDAGWLIFWHRIEAEIDSNQAGFAFDGGVIELSQNGGPFAIVTPVDGYPYLIEDRGTGGPFAAGTPCFSGTADWIRTEVDLSAYAGTVVIRFRFGSDGEGGYAGWFVDDVDVRGMDATVAAPESASPQSLLSLSAAMPNPFNPSTRLDLRIPREGEVRLVIIDANGRIVRKLHDGPTPAGIRSIVWDGRDDSGRFMPSGVYYSRLEQAGQRCTGRLVMLK